jgi:transcription antitermination factor NusG
MERQKPVLEARIPVLRTRGVMNFVGAHGTGTPIPDNQIECVRTLMTRGVSSHPIRSSLSANALGFAVVCETS